LAQLCTCLPNKEQGAQKLAKHGAFEAVSP
jgi:hypothetical protein